MERARRIVEEAGVPAALDDALAMAGLTLIPSGEPELSEFLDGAFVNALVGHLHPATAASLAAQIRAELAPEPAESGRRPRPEPPPGGADALLVPTVPPPAGADAMQEYEDLVSGAVHDRATPAWGVRRPGEHERAGEPLWILITADPALIETAKRSAPGRVEVIVASSMAVLKGALDRAQDPSAGVVVDAERPSIPLDRVTAVLTDDGGCTRILLWRMGRADRDRLAESMPYVRTWVPCDAEVTPAEIVQLLGM